MSHRWQLRCACPPLHLPQAVGRDVDARTARGPHWRRTSTGMYVPAHANRDVVEQRIAEEAGRLPSGGAVTGWAALRLQGGNLFDGTVDGRIPLPVALVVPPTANLRPVPGIVRRRARLTPADLIEVNGVPCTRPCRAVLDEVSLTTDWRAAVAVIDQALAADLIRLEEFTRFLGSLSRAPGLTRARRCLPWVEKRTLSPKETSMRLMWTHDLRLPRPLCNWPVHDEAGRWLGRPDLWSPELAVAGEYDGADHRTLDRQTRDVTFADACREVGLEVFRVTGREIFQPALVRERMQRAIARAERAGLPRRYQWPAHPPWP